MSRGLGSVREDGSGLFSIVYNVTGWSWECLEDWGPFGKMAVVYLVLYVCYRLELGVSGGLGSVWEDGGGEYGDDLHVLVVYGGRHLPVWYVHRQD